MKYYTVKLKQIELELTLTQIIQTNELELRENIFISIVTLNWIIAISQLFQFVEIGKLEWTLKYLFFQTWNKIDIKLKYFNYSCLKKWIRIGCATNSKP